MKKRVSEKPNTSKNSKKIHINIHLTNQWLYTLIAVGILLIIAVGVYGSSLLTPGVAPNPGHTINQLAPPSGCIAGQILEWNGTPNSNGGWDCSNWSSSGISGSNGSSSVWQSTSGGTGIYYNGLVGISTSSPAYNLEVNGNVAATAFFYSSDQRLKTNITNLSGLQSLQNLEKLQGVSFNWKSNGEPDIGFIAQAVQKVYPSLVVNNGTNGTLALNYVGLIAPILESIKIQQQEIANLQLQVDSLQQQVNELKTKS